MASAPRRVTLVHVMNAPFALQYLRGQPAYMRERGIDAQVVTSPGDGLDAFGAAEGMPVHGVRILRKISPWADIRSTARLVRMWRRIRPDIVHAHTPKGGLLGMLSAAIARVPVRVYTIHGFTYMTASGTTRALLRWSDWLSCKLAHRVICVSPSMRQIAIDDGICAPGKLVVLGKGSANGVDAAGRFDPQRFDQCAIAVQRRSFGIDEDGLVMTFVGRIVRDKGVEELAEAWKGLREAFADLHLMMIGPIEERDAIPATVLQQLRDDPRVHFTGLREDVSGILAMSDLVVVPSRREGFGIIFIEAGAMGVPVVATAIPGCVDAVQDGATGTLVAPEDPMALREAIEGYLRDPGMRREHGEAGRRRVLSDFRQDVIWEALHAEYTRLLEARAIRVLHGT